MGLMEPGPVWAKFISELNPKRRLPTMGRIDKYDPMAGGFRAPLAADHAKTEPGNPIGVGLDVNGRVVDGAGNTGITGLLALTQDKKAGDVVDVMTDGEMVEMVGLTAGTLITALDATGVLATTAPGTGRSRIGWTVEATRLIVRLRRSPGGV
jgi:hypothetical protein